MINTKPVDHNEFNIILKKKNFLFEKKPHIAICVSGGVDSLALLILMNKWIKKKKGLLTVLHFNHKLRDDSKKEEFFVKNISMDNVFVNHNITCSVELSQKFASTHCLIQKTSPFRAMHWFLRDISQYV